MFNSFRSRLITVLVCLMMLVQLATAFASLSAMKKESERQGKAALDVASNVFAETLSNRAAQLITAVKILTADFAFKRAVATQEKFTVESVLENHGNRINADLSFLLSPEGRLLASTLSIPEGFSRIDDILLKAKQKGTEGLTVIVEIDKTVYQLVLVPIRAPTTIAWVGMGFALDEALAQEVKNITGLDVSFAISAPLEKGDPETSDERLQAGKTVSTLNDEIISSVFSPFDQMDIHSKDAIFSEDEAYLSMFFALNEPQQDNNLTTQNRLWAILHLPFEPWLQNFRNTRAQLIIIFAITLILAITLGWYATKNMTRPIMKLVAYANRIGQGKSGKPPRINIDELGILSQTLTDMQKNIETREQELQYQANHDGLTGLANRVAVESYLQKQLPRENGCLVLVNIRQFKNINSMLGFDNGDQLLCEVALRLQTITPAPELLARLGGDEFLLIFSDDMPPDKIKKTLAPLDTKFLLSDSSLHLRTSIGILPFDISHHDVNDIMRRIDIANHSAKNHSDGITVYQTGEDENYQRELTIIRDLQGSLDNNHIYVVYQPKVNLLQQRCLSAEALIRWQHPELGFIPPDQFISLIENAGNIQLVTQWMIRAVLRQLAAWKKEGMEMQVAVNLSANDLCDPSLPEVLKNGLAEAGLAPSALALEVTEGAVMQDTDTVIRVLQALREMGIQLAIDDFGTGQSSLAYLKQLPVHEVKIDRAFVKDIENNTNDELIVSATVQLSKSLGLKVTAEGLENVAGLSKVTECRCDIVQGYYFSKPLKADEFRQWVALFHTTPGRWFPA